MAYKIQITFFTMLFFMARMAPLSARVIVAQPTATPRQMNDINQISEEDRQLLKKIQKDSLQYFLIHTDSETGLTKDSSRSSSPASIAATGFALASFAIASQNGWLSYREAYQRIERTFDTLEHRAAGEKGFFYHFLDPKTGKRIWNSELSSIDTALLIAGALLAATYFKGTGLEIRAQRLYDRVDWNWMRNGTLFLCHGWKPNSGFLPHYWDMYSEHLILQALALGSETNPVPREVWYAWDRRIDSYNSQKIVYAYTGSLFTYQYAQAFIDFRSLNDRDINYYDNSAKATRANREYCLFHQDQYRTYRNGVWGISACLGPDGYKAYGAKPGLGMHDGTVASYAPIASIVFTPHESMSAIRAMHDKYGERLYDGSLGFRDSFNLDQNWWAEEQLGVDQGITVLMLENFLNNAAVWKQFMKIPSIQRWIARAGLGKEN